MCEPSLPLLCWVAHISQSASLVPLLPLGPKLHDRGLDHVKLFQRMVPLRYLHTLKYIYIYIYNKAFRAKSIAQLTELLRGMIIIQTKK